MTTSRRTPKKRALELLRRAASTAPYFLIHASGGKDSNVAFPLLAELQREDPRVRFAALHWYMVPPEEVGGRGGIQCVERPVRVLCARYKVPLLWVPHYTLPDRLYEGITRHGTSETRGCSVCAGKGGFVGSRPRLRQLVKDGEEWEACERCGGCGQGALAVKVAECEDAGRLDWAARLGGLKGRKDLTLRDADDQPLHPVDALPVHPWRDIWCVSGHRSNDSLERRAMLSSFRMQKNEAGVVTGARPGLNVKERRVYPVFDWTTDDVLAYARASGCPPAADLGGLNTMNLDPRNPEVVERLKVKYPRDYARLLEVFPQALASSELEGDG